jgi:DNA phosphorothioation-dependent restriction protein DptG
VAEVFPNLHENFEVTVLVMPGSRLKSITNAAKKEIATLTRDDVIVVWGGANDIGKNESSKGLSHISSFVKNRGHTNIVITNEPHRHDLYTTSCINNEVKVFNRKLLKEFKRYDYAKVMETNLSREYFTQHRLHMNRLRK